MDFGLYIHWPFCVSKCPYCDFNSHVRERIDEARWCAAYLRTLEHWKAQIPQGRIASIFFGGGTPSLMDPSTTKAIIDKARGLWTSVNDLEITLEANPSSIEAGRFADFRGAGVNRVSIGVQSLRDDVLKFLGRPHDVAEAKAAVEIAAKHFDRYSFDLIYGRPDQSVKDWEVELAEALPLTNGHLSAYQLTIEKGTAFHTYAARGDFVMPDEETQAAFFESTIDAAAGHGLNQYEVSNFASPDQESRHNLIYWRMKPYIGIGPGAHGRVEVSGVRCATVEHRAPEAWLEKVEMDGQGGHASVPLSERETFDERVMMGLRLNEGMTTPPGVLAKAETLAGEGYLEAVALPGRLVPTRRGLMCLNAVTAFLLG